MFQPILVAVGRKGGGITMDYLIALAIILFLVLCVVLALVNRKD